jgi:uncharacterized protein YqeY
MRKINHLLTSGLMKILKEDLTLAMKAKIQLMKSVGGGESLYGTANILTKANDQITVSRAIISMCPDIKKKPNTVTDEDVTTLLKRFIGAEKERELYVQKFLTEKDVTGLNFQQLKKLVKNTISELGDKLTTGVIEVAKGYLPKKVSDEVIKAWIVDNIEFGAFKNKMQAMGPIMKYFQGTDGKRVRDILEGLNGGIDG